MEKIKNKLNKIWQNLYPGKFIPDEFFIEINSIKSKLSYKNTNDWYKDAVVYSLYVDLYNQDFNGLKDKLEYLQDLGVSCLWLLPILDSPMRDAGFDIKNYKSIRPALLGLSENASDEEKICVFREFLNEAHQRGIHVIFDIAINHTSNQHPWFLQSRKSVDNPYRDYYIWNKDTHLYKETRLLFEGMCPSNWEKDGEWFYFHRFFEFQPDLNYKNPEVLLEMTKSFLFWLQQGVDGFRADAIPYLWKENGTDCENLPKTHNIVKFFRSVLDYVKPGTLLLAEACQPPLEVVKYIGSGDECHAGYHFPLMPQMFKAIEMQSSLPIKNTLDFAVTPAIPADSQWFMFLRCHDELSLEKVYVSEDDREYIHSHYCHQPEWNFRLGQGISARLSELMKKNPDKISLAYSVMLSLPGTPVIYYGDEFGKLNDEDYYREQIKLTGKDDTRFLVRGKVNWKQVKKDLNDTESFSYQIFSRIKKMINIRNQHLAFGRGELEWIDGLPDEILGFYRLYKEDKILVLNNLSDKPIKLNHSIIPENAKVLLAVHFSESNIIEGFGYLWIKV